MSPDAVVAHLHAPIPARPQNVMPWPTAHPSVWTNLAAENDVAPSNRTCLISDDASDLPLLPQNIVLWRLWLKFLPRRWTEYHHNKPKDHIKMRSIQIH